ncbi:MAG: ABC-three component system protein [Rhodoglobus sp.]
MKYAYEDQSPDQFETLVTLLCQDILGTAVQGFATGPDGGRDARFEGTAQLHPSTADPWRGRVIIQAKHTNGFNRSFSEAEFYSKDRKSSVLGDELARIQALRGSGELDHYMLFSNRQLTGGTESEVRQLISSACSLPTASVYLCGVEQLELWLRRFKHVPEMAALDPLDSPLIVSPEDLAEVVEAFARHTNAIDDVLDDPPTERVSLATKNRLNGMTDAYAKLQRRKYLKDTDLIRRFLAAPENSHILPLYEGAADEFQAKIIAHREDYQSFDKAMEYLIDLLFARDAVLRQRGHKRLTRALVFYMYWNCDIGETEESDAQADEALAP